MTKIHIICFGNPLYADDGAGLMVFELLSSALQRKPEWNESVDIYYAGNSGQCAFPYFMSCSHLIIVDAIQRKNISHPGRIYRLSEQGLSQLESNDLDNDISSHRLDLTKSWQLLTHCRDSLPELTIFAIELAQATLFSSVISDEVQRSSHQVTEEIMHLCERALH